MQSAPSPTRKSDLGTPSQQHTPSPSRKRGTRVIAEITESPSQRYAPRTTRKNDPEGDGISNRIQSNNIHRGTPSTPRNHRKAPSLYHLNPTPLVMHRTSENT
uniref:NB-ARC domain containing protein n=1 Tax=Solanum tuberosum TaxID=4113 RepID=M1DZE7_SOLTU